MDILPPFRWDMEASLGTAPAGEREGRAPITGRVLSSDGGPTARRSDH